MKKIVVVDDNERYAKIVSDFIKHNDGLDTIIFSNPEEALRYIVEEKDIYAVVSDYEMPKMNGFELAKQVEEKSPNTKIIIMSGHNTEYLEEVSVKYGLENKVRLLCKINIINLIAVLLS